MRITDEIHSRVPASVVFHPQDINGVFYAQYEVFYDRECGFVICGKPTWNFGGHPWHGRKDYTRTVAWSNRMPFCNLAEERLDIRGFRTEQEAKEICDLLNRLIPYDPEKDAYKEPPYVED